MTGMENFWDKSPVFFDRGRCLTEYILPDLKEKYVNLSEEAITDLKELPCVFAYEKFIKQDAKIGKVLKFARQMYVLTLNFLGTESHIMIFFNLLNY